MRINNIINTRLFEDLTVTNLETVFYWMYRETKEKKYVIEYIYTKEKKKELIFLFFYLHISLLRVCDIMYAILP